MRTVTLQYFNPHVRFRSAFCLILGITLVFSVLLAIPINLLAQNNNPNSGNENTPGSCSFVVEKTFGPEYFESGGSIWTRFIWKVTNNNTNGISHLTFPLPTGSGCEPPYLGQNVTNWAMGYYSTDNSNWIGQALTFGEDPSCTASGSTPVLKLGGGELAKVMYVKLELKGIYLEGESNFFIKYGNFCCSVELGIGSGGGIGCFRDCVLEVEATAPPINCYGGTTTITATPTGNFGTVQYTLAPGGASNNTGVFTGIAAGTYTVTAKNGDCFAYSKVVITEPPQLTAETKPTNPDCFGGTGSIELTVSGGTPGYTYLWNDGNMDKNRSGLEAGTYNVTITDSKGCTETAEATITVPDDITATAVPTNPNCFGGKGSIELTVSGGTPGYTYLWNDGNMDKNRSGLEAGTYNVTITDSKGCTETAEATITVPDDITATAVPTNPNCFGGTGSIELTVSGGTPGYTYLWNDGNMDKNRSGLEAGTYNVTITDSKGCTETAEATITVPDDITATAVPTNPNCFGGKGSIELTVSGGTPGYTYLWNDGNMDKNRAGLEAGTYNVTITDSKGCTETAEATITVPDDITATAVPTNPNCFGGTGSIELTVSGGTPGYTYLWNDGNMDKNRSGLEAGTYNVTITDSKGCTETAEATITVPDDITATAVPTNPNCFGGTGSIELTVSGGTPGYTYLWNDGNMDKNRSGLEAGTYNVTITDSKGCTETAEATITVPDDITATAVPTNPNCFGGKGSIELTVSGGTPGYTYLWNDGNMDKNRSGLEAGTYNVTITDSKGCTEIAVATITVPTDIKVVATVATPVICEGNTTEVTVTAYGGTGTLQYSLDNVTFNAFTSMNAGIYTATITIGASTTVYVKDVNECTKPLAISITVRKCENFCTYTQGYFGNDEGLSLNPDGGGNASYLGNNGCTQSRVNATITYAKNSGSMPSMLGNIPIGSLSADAIISYLPGGGPSAQYIGDALPNSKNTLVAQLLTLALNMGLNADLALFRLPESGVIYTQRTGDCGTGTASGSCNAYTFNEIGKNMTIGELYAAASAALLSGTNGQRSAYANVADAINRAFDECAKICIPETTVDPSNLLTFTSNQRPTATATSRNLKVKAYPNPFTDRIFINFTSPVAGKAVVEIFDISGRRLAEINKGQVNAFAENKVEYMVPTSARSAIIYKVTVGSYSITGRMIAPTR